MNAETQDTALIAAIASGDERAFCLLAERYMDKIYYFVYRQLGDRDEAEDITQDVFLKLWQSPHLFDPSKGRFQAWLWTMAGNLCRDRFRKNKFHHSPDALDNIVDFSPLPDKQAEDANQLAFIIEQIEQLPERQRHVLYLYIYDELSYKEIAAVIEVSPAAVESLLARARSTLKNNPNNLVAKKEVANAC